MGTHHILGCAVIHGHHLSELGNLAPLKPVSINTASFGIFLNNSLLDYFISFLDLLDLSMKLFIFCNGFALGKLNSFFLYLFKTSIIYNLFLL